MAAGWVAAHELWFLVPAGLPLLFPRGRWPWLALGAVGLIWCCRRVALGRFTLRTGLEAPILILFLMAGLGCFISVDPAMSQARFWSLVLGAALFYGFANLTGIQSRASAMIVLLALLVLGVGILGLVGTDWSMTRLVPLPWLYDRFPTLVWGLPGSSVPLIGQINPRVLGIVMGTLAPVFIAVAFFSPKPKLKLFSGVVALLAVLMVLLSQSLQGLAALGAGLFFLLVWRSRWTLLLIPIGSAVLVSALNILGPSRLATYLLSPQNSRGIAVVLRLDMWSRALAMLRDMPYTGIGLNTFPAIQSRFYPGFLLGLELHAHNLYLQTALDLGLPGLFAFLWLLAAWFFVVSCNYRLASSQEYRILLVGLAAGMIAYLAHGFMDSMVLVSEQGAALWILLGMGAALPATSLPEKRRAVRGMARLPALNWSMAALLAGGLLASMMLAPAALPMNLATLQAHPILFRGDSADASSATRMGTAHASLLQALSIDEGNSQAYELLGEIAAWNGDVQQALEAFNHRVTLDMQDPLAQYFPSEYLLRRIQGTDLSPTLACQDLVQTYSNWMVRYPQRAENYVLLSLTQQSCQAGASQASQVLKLGLQNGAEPRSLLEYALQVLSH